jgi:hypothetical protein
MPRGISPKREHEYEELVDEFRKDHRYEGREEEVASRIVNKQRAQHAETKEAKEQDRHHESPDRNLPIKNFDSLDVDEVTAKLDKLSKDDLKTIRRYEEHHNDRKTLIEQLDRRLDHAGNP